MQLCPGPKVPGVLLKPMLSLSNVSLCGSFLNSRIQIIWSWHWLSNRLRWSVAQGRTLELELGGIVVVELAKRIQKGTLTTKPGALASIVAQERQQHLACPMKNSKLDSLHRRHQSRWRCMRCYGPCLLFAGDGDVEVGEDENGMDRDR